ncbi:hypothetical protein SO802_018670 [Lithocarpus litseifolius]|uniref:RNase H type-1 domain-containing protein n=1 Tax=Lithocarpus litseifolius TaxID=425828 RepID=A0AAW2CNE2_9ROSI
MAFTLEEIWDTRNNAIFNKAPIDLHHSVNHIHHKLKEAMFALCEPPPPGPTISTQPPPLSWSPPPPGWIKVNIDAALSSSKASLAVVARDHHGVAIKAWARITNAIPPLQAEAQALLWAVKLAKCEGWSHVMFEGDAKGVFDPLSIGKASPDWSINVVSSDILELAEFFDSFSFVWVKRSCLCSNDAALIKTCEIWMRSNVL